MEDDATQQALVDASTHKMASTLSDEVTVLSHKDQPASSMLNTKPDAIITSDSQLANTQHLDGTPDSTDKEEKQDSTPDGNKEDTNSIVEQQDPVFKEKEKGSITIGEKQDLASSIEKNESFKGEKRQSASNGKKQDSVSKGTKVCSVPKTKKQGSTSKEKKQGSACKEKTERSTAKGKKGSAAKENEESTTPKPKKQNLASKGRKQGSDKKQNSASKKKKQDSVSKEIKQDLVSKEMKQDKRKSTKNTKQQRKRSRTVAFGSEDHNTELGDDAGMKKKKQKTEQSQTDTVQQKEVVTPMGEEKNAITESASAEKEGTSHESNNEDTPQVDSSLLKGSSLTADAEMKENSGSGGESGLEWEDRKGTPHRRRITKHAVHCPICGRKFTSLSRLYQFHYTEGSQTCSGPKRMSRTLLDKIKKGSYACPSCGKMFTSLARLNQYHYDEATQTCSDSRPCVVTCYSDGVNAALSNQQTSEQELYAAISEVALPTN